MTHATSPPAYPLQPLADVFETLRCPDSPATLLEDEPTTFASGLRMHWFVKESNGNEELVCRWVS